jgi:hypothetical protein
MYVTQNDGKKKVLPFMFGTVYELFSILSPLMTIIVRSTCNNGCPNISSGSIANENS